MLQFDMTLLDEIEQFLVRTGMTATAFGKEAMGDPRFVFQLREGRECRQATRLRARKFVERQKTAA